MVWDWGLGCRYIRTELRHLRGGPTVVGLERLAKAVNTKGDRAFIPCGPSLGYRGEAVGGEASRSPCAELNWRSRLVVSAWAGRVELGEPKIGLLYIMYIIGFTERFVNT